MVFFVNSWTYKGVKSTCIQTLVYLLSNPPAIFLEDELYGMEPHHPSPFYPRLVFNQLTLRLSESSQPSYLIYS